MISNDPGQTVALLPIKLSVDIKNVWTSSLLNYIVTVTKKMLWIGKAMIAMPPITFLGHTLSDIDLAEIREVIDTCRNLSRTEIANTICELFSWERPSGKLKTVECRQFLEQLESMGLVNLPLQRTSNPNSILISPSEKTNPTSIISCDLNDLLPISITKVTTKAQRQLWYEFVERYHYLGYRLPFGAQLRYFIELNNHPTTYLGCLQFSSPAWKMTCRDKWIAWDDRQRAKNLQKIICNSRFLILPWIQIKNLASFTLALALRQVADDWNRVYGIKPVLVETLVDRQRFKGTCYKAANWRYLGETTGRGRMDRVNRRRDLSPKDIYVYPLTQRFRQELLI
ncbi:MAG: Druantia anti-phage system protein DruA [Pedobacter sp.]